ncbi:hypothetical protein EYC84_003813 [Monilinia fructicola]|uniref:Uncharacterized protein n=1 Tax=Monilinia fructicola TaxID=38448 RepID=A0A5M9JZM1_MONFR|nr:hypothetical protein EYC84_003813 [Monilinia fructicola]
MVNAFAKIPLRRLADNTVVTLEVVFDTLVAAIFAGTVTALAPHELDSFCNFALRLFNRLSICSVCTEVDSSTSMRKIKLGLNLKHMGFGIVIETNGLCVSILPTLNPTD